MARKPKVVTREQAAAKQAKAVQFLRDVVRDPDKADEFAGMSVQEYAQHKGLTLENPHKSRVKRTIKLMPDGPTKRELEEALDEVADLLDEALDAELTREEVIAKVKEAAALASGEEEEEQEDQDED